MGNNSYEFKVLLIILVAASFAIQGSVCETWCPVGIHAYHALKNFKFDDLNGVMCSDTEACLILKNFTMGETSQTMVAGICVPLAVCQGIRTPTCNDIASQLPHLTKNTGTEFCSVWCCYDEANCRKAMKIKFPDPHRICIRREEKVKFLEPDRNCRKSCTKQNQCRGKTKRCVCDDWCGMSCINPKRKCALPQVSKPLNVKYMGNKKQVAKYSCRNGYFPDGDVFSQCRSDHKWSGKTPTCKAGCTPPIPVVDNAIAFSTKQGYKAGEEVHFVCGYGFILTGNPVVRCNADGSWSKQNFRCEENSCGLPPASTDSYISPEYPMVDKDGAGNLVARYRCLQGYTETAGNPNIFCNPGKVRWTPLTLVCKIEQDYACPTIKSANGLLVTISRDGKSARFSCTAGLRLMGRRSARCHEDGYWNGIIPYCTVEQCVVEESQLQPGVSIQTIGFPQTRYAVGQKAVLQCNGKQVATLDCRDGGVWSNEIQLISCPVERCTIDRSLLRRNVEIAGSDLAFAIGEKVTLRCFGQDFATLECGRDSAWSEDYTGLTCVESRCPEIEENAHLTVTYLGDRFLGSMAIAKCRNRDSNVWLRCFSGFKWNTPVPTCADGSCTLLEAPHLHVTDPFSGSSDITSGTTVTFGCKNPKMSLQGDSQATCMDGKWNKELPTCGCHEFGGLPDHLSVEMRSGGSVAQFRCDQWHDMVGSSYLNCLDSGEWSNPVPTCQERGCEIDMYLLSSGITVNNQPSNGVVKFPRRATATLFCNGKPIKDITCGEKSRWSEDYGLIECMDPKPTPSNDRMSNKKPTDSNRPKCNCQCGVAGDVDEILDSTILARVVGGDEAVPHAWPWQVAVVVKGDTADETIENVQGGGTLISQNWILTAAHIFEYEKRRNQYWQTRFVFGLGTHNVSSLADLNGREVFYLASAIYIHKEFSNKGLANDIALVRVGKYFNITTNLVMEGPNLGKVVFNEYIRPVCLPCMDTCNGIIPRGKNFNAKECAEMTKKVFKRIEIDNTNTLSSAVVTGYGHTTKRSPVGAGRVKTAKRLQQGVMTLKSEKYCSRMLKKMGEEYNSVPKIAEGTICVSGGGIVDACTGDSGGPLVRLVKAKNGECWHQLGVVSWGVGCATRYPGFYVDVVNFVPWIIDIVFKNA